MFEPRDVIVSVRKDFTNCLTFTNLNLHTGRADYTVPFNNATCLNLLFPLPTEFTIQWDDGSHSTIVAMQYLVANEVVVLGSVIEGRFNGLPYREVDAILTLSTPLDCLSTEGARRATGLMLAVDIGL